MFIVTRTRTRAQENEDGELVAVKTLQHVHYEENVDKMRAQLGIGDDRLAGIRIFHMDVDDDGVPAIGTEVKP